MQIGASVDSVNNWEKGRREPRTDLWPAIIRYVGYETPCPNPRRLEGVYAPGVGRSGSLRRPLLGDSALTQARSGRWRQQRVRQHKRVIDAINQFLAGR